MSEFSANIYLNVSNLVQFVDGSWYWNDELCEEPNGPFETHDDAYADYCAVRQVSSADQGVER